MKIITISREFGSGGREVGKRLADELGFAYYDREIIAAVAKNSELDEGYVEKILETGIPRTFPFSFGRSFAFSDVSQQNYTKALVAQQSFIIQLARKGDDFVIVGRSSDVILSEYFPLNIFVHADMYSKIDRCIDRAPEDEELTRREYERKIKQIDSARARHRALLSDSPWGKKESYHLCVNTTGKEIKALVPGIAAYAKAWFGEYVFRRFSAGFFITEL